MFTLSDFSPDSLSLLVSSLPTPMASLLGFVVTASVLSLVFLRPKRRRNGRWSGPKRVDAPAALNLSDPKDQIAAVSRVSFERRQIMNRGEFALFRVLEDQIAQFGGAYRLMAQTSLGELIRPSADGAQSHVRRAAHASINSKRLDFAIIDRSGFLALAIEFQGTGHHLGENAFMRDAVKREALRKAGVQMMEVETGWTPEDVQRRLCQALGRPSSGAAVASIARAS